MPWQHFHPATAAWFRQRFAAPTAAQVAAWEAVRSGRHVLVAAPTGSGKTLAAFLTAIDQLLQQAVSGELDEATQVVYVSPLKALSNDIQLNLEQPLQGITEHLASLGLPAVQLRSMVRTGDTPQAERTAMRKSPPHIVVTTPESLYILLGSESGRRMLASTRSVIVDEIHALAPNKRGCHLALSLQRLEALCGRGLQRIGLSATQKPIEEVARFLVGSAAIDPQGVPDCAIVDVGHQRARDLALVLPDAPLTAVMSNEVWEQLYRRIADLVSAHRTTLVFVNTRRLAERASRHLGELLGKDAVAAHHGSLARELRLDAEQRLKRGELKVLVATASLELGIDIGHVELVCQIGSPRSISSFLQRVGRAGHAVDGTPKGRLFPLSRDELVECVALLDAVQRGELDTLCIEREALDVLAQQMVAEVASQDWDEAALYELVRGAYPYAELSHEAFRASLRMLAEGYSTQRGLRAAYLHRDTVNQRLRARRGARLTALTSGGAIPDTADYQVMLEPQAQLIGSVHEDFAVESLAGDVFQLGNHSYRILRVEQGRIRVEDAQGQPPNVPFWLGEAPGRSDALSLAVSRLRETWSSADDKAALSQRLPPDEAAWQQLDDYLQVAGMALGGLPTQQRVVIERFFDESGGTQLVIHSPFGSRINRAWGLALRKRFCRQFNFELQAAASEDAIVLSLSTSHSFPLIEVSRYLHSNSVADVLTQALLDAPMFGLRWRWNATSALALPRFVGGKRVAPQLQRMRSEDLLASVFPDQVACLENIVGERQIPDHPLVRQTLHDCLHEAMDLDGLIALLQRIENGSIEVVARELTAPSPLAAEILNARPYAFLDDAPLEERRTQAVQSRRWRDPAELEQIGNLSAEAIDSVRQQAWPEVRDAEELHEALLGLGWFTEQELAANWAPWLAPLQAQGRACRLQIDSQHIVWLAVERLPPMLALFPAAKAEPRLKVPDELASIEWSAESALIELLRGRLSGLGPQTSTTLCAGLPIAATAVEVALLALQGEGYVMRGRFSSDASADQWCERHLLARIHRYTLGQLRREIEPVEPRDYLRFALRWQHLEGESRLKGPDALPAVLAQLEGYEAPASIWESELLPSRIADYDIAWLDELCLSGRLIWNRLRGNQGNTPAAGPVHNTPLVLLPRRHLAWWRALVGTAAQSRPLSSRAQRLVNLLESRGALFFDELEQASGLLRVELEDALGELVATGRVVCDSFAGLRALLQPASKRSTAGQRAGRRSGRRPVAMWSSLDSAGRWSLLPVVPAEAPARAELVEHVARCLLRRYGVIAWRMLEREPAWLPPWRELLRVFQRLEARGEIRGGRFIAGLSGEQFALPEALTALRKLRHQPDDQRELVLSAADPLNLVGSVLAGERLPQQSDARICYRNGVPIARCVGAEFVTLQPLSDAEQRRLRTLMLSSGKQRQLLAEVLPAAADKVVARG
ncbi:DEAD/DEAH box helicase [Pseudomarimonas arenosa]|uniref:DEAD/DEAH box helicase n=1 Tax=Pseudomarimonas arenosa TaxID=2774145 RepID=A0AAW3ZLR5_9GAMM|nr:DEAD/DEAH box helicase [Pseudomarimonas arenosa]MBD8526688.1 DEAD/DEAH box helicase [Pseudomarimonas arenosa]